MTYEEAIDKVILASSAWELEDDEVKALQMLIDAGRNRLISNKTITKHINYDNTTDPTPNRRSERINRLRNLAANGNQYQKRLTQQEIADKVSEIAGSCSVSTVNRWIKDGKFPCFEHLEALAIIYNVDIAYLLGETANCSTCALARDYFIKATNLSPEAYQILLSARLHTERIKLIDSFIRNLDRMIDLLLE